MPGVGPAVDVVRRKIAIGTVVGRRSFGPIGRPPPKMEVTRDGDPEVKIMNLDSVHSDLPGLIEFFRKCAILLEGVRDGTDLRDD